MISFVSPFYNESAILEDSLESMLYSLSKIEDDWEFIIVNDGSTDESLAIAQRFVDNHSENINLITYPVNQGRGFALKCGIDCAKGDIIVTTEIDLSWGEDAGLNLANYLKLHQNADIVIASPHLSDGGYKNVPFRRRMLSRWGNIFIRTFVSNRITMYTGMTRAYRASVIKRIPVMEKGKEFHLETIFKAISFGYHIEEIPCVLEWKTHKTKAIPGARKRKSSSNVNRLISTHLLFGISARPIRYLWGTSFGIMVTSFLFLAWGVARLFLEKIAIFAVLTSAVLGIISLLLFIFGVIASQNNAIQKELWKVQQEVDSLTKTLKERW